MTRTIDLISNVAGIIDSGSADNHSRNSSTQAYVGQRTKLKRSRLLKTLEVVDASTLPADVLVLLSQYAKAITEHDGTVIQLSSIKVFKHVQRTSRSCDDARVQLIYRKLLARVSSHVRRGEMYLNGRKPKLSSSKPTNNILSVNQMMTHSAG